MVNAARVIGGSLFALVVAGPCPAWADPRPWGGDVRLTFHPAASQLSFNFAWSVAADVLGAVHIVWYDDRDGAPQVHYGRSLDGGSTWEAERRLSESPLGASNPAIAASGRHVYAVWHDFRHGRPDVYFRASADQGLSWGPETRLTGGVGDGAHPSVAASGDRVQVVWGSGRDGQAEVYTRGSADRGATWGPETRVSEPPYESWVSTVAVAGVAVYVAWVDYRDANEEEYVRVSPEGGVSWGPPTR